MTKLEVGHPTNHVTPTRNAGATPAPVHARARNTAVHVLNKIYYVRTAVV